MDGRSGGTELHWAERLSLGQQPGKAVNQSLVGIVRRHWFSLFSADFRQWLTCRCYYRISHGPGGGSKVHTRFRSRLEF